MMERLSPASLLNNNTICEWKIVIDNEIPVIFSCHDNDHISNALKAFFNRIIRVMSDWVYKKYSNNAQHDYIGAFLEEMQKDPDFCFLTLCIYIGNDCWKYNAEDFKNNLNAIFHRKLLDRAIYQN